MHPADRRNRIIVIVGVVVAIGAIVVIIGSARLINREMGAANPRNTAPPMTDYVPPTVTGVADVAYGDASREKLDVWYPKSVAEGEALPTIIWLHGGGWSIGDKAVIAPYIQILADRGFTTVGMDYAYAPDHRYPTQVRQLNSALGFLEDHAAELHVDPSRFVLAGDSAGAQISAQVAALTTDESFADELGISPSLEPDQIAGVLIASGIYDLKKATKLGTSMVDYIDGYLGTTTDRSKLEQASVTNHLTKNFPPTWVTGGNADPLTAQAQDFADRLKHLGVRVDTKFFSPIHVPPLIHEYQFNLGSDDAQDALESAVKFLKDVTK